MLTRHLTSSPRWYFFSGFFIMMSPRCMEGTRPLICSPTFTSIPNGFIASTVPYGSKEKTWYPRAVFSFTRVAMSVSVPTLQIPSQSYPLQPRLSQAYEQSLSSFLAEHIIPVFRVGTLPPKRGLCLLRHELHLKRNYSISAPWSSCYQIPTPTHVTHCLHGFYFKTVYSHLREDTEMSVFRQ